MGGGYTRNVMSASTTKFVPVASATQRARPKRRTRLLLGFILVFLLLVALLWWIGVFGGNVRVVVPGRVYRSAQLTGNNYTADTARWIGDDLNDVLRRYHIRTVINLRGGGMANDYYRQEIADCKRLGVVHVDIPMSAHHLPPPQSLRQLLAVFDHQPYPILFHCQGGADRSGRVGALYLNIYQGVPLQEALHRQLTWRYGHFAFTAAGRMNDFFSLYRRTAHGLSLRDWINTVYPTLYLKVSRSAAASS
jgi:protein tyrosine phosphatase (PTP) superfamily phosphohydrolase (DUF442 family)